MKHFRFFSASQQDAEPAHYAEVDQLLGHLRAAPGHAEGLESRILTRLENEPRRSTRMNSRAPSLRGWAPGIAAAALLCLVAGGFMVARDTRPAPRMEAALPAGSVPQARALPEVASDAARNPGAGIADRGQAGLGPAAARSLPPAPVSAGRRRGRATGTARVSTR
jgi:hypothetical protein